MLYLTETSYLLIVFGCSGALVSGWFMSFWMILLSLTLILLKEYYDSRVRAARFFFSFFWAGVSGD